MPLSYAVGLVVVNAYLLSLGVADFDLFRPRYIATGLLVLSIVLGATATAMFAEHNLRTFTLQRGVPLVERAFGLLEAVMPVGLVLASFVSILHQSIYQALVLFFGSAAVGRILVNISYVIRAAGDHFRIRPSLSFMPRWLISRSKSYETWQPPPAPTWVRTISWLALATISSYLLVSVFALSVLPSVPEQFGGARPKESQFVISSDDRNLVAELGIPYSADTSHLTTSLEVLFEGADYYLVQIPWDETTRFKLGKDAVVGVRLDSECSIESGCLGE